MWFINILPVDYFKTLDVSLQELQNGVNVIQKKQNSVLEVFLQNQGFNLVPRIKPLYYSVKVQSQRFSWAHRDTERSGDASRLFR